MGIPSAPGKFRVPAPKPIPTPVLPLKGRGPKPSSESDIWARATGTLDLAILSIPPDAHARSPAFPRFRRRPGRLPARRSRHHDSDAREIPRDRFRSEEHTSYAEPDKVAITDLALDLKVDFGTKTIPRTAPYTTDRKDTKTPL